MQPNLRKRAGGKSQAEAEKNGPEKSKPDVKKPEEDLAAIKKAKEQRWALITLLFVFAVMFLNLWRISTTRGWAFVFGFSQSLSLTPEQWHQTLKNHTTVMIGGPHRGGTSILWKCLREHSQVASFGYTSGSKADESEGMFIQNVYPRWGIGQGSGMMLQGGSQTNLQTRIDRGIGGLGVYALGPESKVHLTENDTGVTLENQAELLNAFGYHWNLEKPVLLEKTPANAVMTRFLQALLNLGNSAWDPKQPAGGGESVVRFIFISRDPLANALAHDALADVVGVPLHKMVENWLAVHEYFMSDKEQLQHVRVIRLEDFVTNPASHISSLWEWMGLEVPNGLAEKTVERLKVVSNPNQKYMVQYCNAMIRGGNAKVEAHLHLIKEFNDRIKRLNLGYDLALWCVDPSMYVK